MHLHACMKVYTLLDDDGNVQSSPLDAVCMVQGAGGMEKSDINENIWNATLPTASSTVEPG